MIRDPSDGSVREERGAAEATGAHEAQAAAALAPAKPTFDTGLREPSRKPEAAARLNASREWLKTYHAKKGSIT